MARDPEPSTTGTAVERSFALLQAVVAAGEPIGVRELGRRTGLPRSTASRLVGGLVGLGMVERTDDRLVVPGSALATLQPAGGPAPLLRDQLRPLVLELAELHRESVALAVDDGDAVLYLSQVDAASPVRAPDVEAQRHPFHVVAHGLALMAWWDEDRLDAYLAGDLAAPTSQSMVDAQALRRRLGSIRREGTVWTLEEFDTDVNGVATVIMDRDAPVASIGYFGPSYRLRPDREPALATAMRDLAERRARVLLGN